jgi:hypothetical protein
MGRHRFFSLIRVIRVNPWLRICALWYLAGNYVSGRASRNLLAAVSGETGE